MVKQNMPLEVGVVGCGAMSRSHGSAGLESQEPVQFVACCDVRPEAARTFADVHGSAVYADYREMVKRENLEAVLLLTWPNQHRRQIEDLLNAGIKNILCEKALTLTGSEAAEIWRMTQESEAFLMEGFMYRHHPAIMRMEQVLVFEDTGPVDSVRACFSNFDAEVESVEDGNRNWRQRKECGGGIPYDFACYCVNACAHFTAGLPVRVYCRGDLSEKYHTINRMYGMIEYDNGRVGIIQSSKKAAFNQELQVICARGILTLPVAWTPKGRIVITWRHSSRWAETLENTYQINPDNSYRLQLENFVRAIRQEAQPVMPLIESVVNTFTLDALVTSLLEKRIVDVALPDDIREAFARYTASRRQPGST